MQEILVFIVIFTAVSFLAYKVYKQFFSKKSTCETCSFSQIKETENS